MRASLTIGGIEVAIATAAGSSLEKVVARRYAPFLGAVEVPSCSILLESNRRDEGFAELSGTDLERIGETKFRVAHPGLFGLLDIAGTGFLDLASSPQTIDYGLRLLFGLLAPKHDALLLRATSLIGDDGAHVFLGASEMSVLNRIGGPLPTMTDGLVMVRWDPSGWLVVATPFGASYETPGPAREERLAGLWFLETAGPPSAVDIDDAGRFIGGHAFVPTGDFELCRRALWVGERLATEVPLSVLRFDPPPLTWASTGSRSLGSVV